MADSQKLVHNSFNPVKGKLQSMQECLEQLRGALPKSQEEYISADRMTHSFVKSCFLMIIQRAVDTNSIVIEVSGKRPPHNSIQTFLAIWQDGAIDDKILGFFQSALEQYQKIVNPYEDLSDAEIYDVAQALLKHGEEYTKQITGFLAKGTQPPKSLDLRIDSEEKPEVTPDQPALSHASETTASPISPQSPVQQSELSTDEKERIMDETNGNNYKGELQNYCHMQRLPIPTYHSVAEGPPNEPSWIVTVKWGDNEYTTPEPIGGSKKYAEQMAAKQVLKTRVEGEEPSTPLPDVSQEKSETELEEELESQLQAVVSKAPEQKLTVPVTVIQTALGIANFRLSEQKRGGRFNEMSNAEYTNQLAKLTMEIVKAVEKEAKQQRIEIRER